MRIVFCPCLVLVFLLTGCGLRVPTDPRGTLDAVRASQELTVGVSHAPPWTVVRGSRITGTEVDLVRTFAARLGADPRWVVGGAQHLVDQLEQGEIHLIIGGITTDTPWTTKVSPTRSYARSVDDEGKEHKHVMLVQFGENEFLSELERYLDERSGKLR